MFTFGYSFIFYVVLSDIHSLPLFSAGEKTVDIYVSSKNIYCLAGHLER